MFAVKKIKKRLIASYLAGNCNAVDKATVEQWIGASAKNAELFEQYKTIWRLSALPAPISDFDQDEALASVKKRISKMQNPGSEIYIAKPHPNPRKAIYRYAASIAAVFVIALASYLLVRLETRVPTNAVTAHQKTMEPLIFPDGSKVYLNAGATVTFPEKFGNDQRQVTLSGEAFFEVEHEADWPFVVLTSNLGVKVLGTSFNVNACDKLTTVEVAIQSGKVLFYSFDAKSGDVLEQLILNQGEKGIYYKTCNVIARTELENNNYWSWKSGLLEFNNTPLPEVITALERTYDLRFTTDRDLSHLALTARFDHEKPEYIVETLRLVFGLRIEQSDNEVRIF